MSGGRGHWDCGDVSRPLSNQHKFLGLSQKTFCTPIVFLPYVSPSVSEHGNGMDSIFSVLLVIPQHNIACAPFPAPCGTIKGFQIFSSVSR